MAKRKKSSKRRKVGAASMLNPKSPVVKIAATAVGYLLADKINAAIAKVVPAPAATATTPATGGIAAYLPYAQVGIGALLLMKGKPSLLKTGLGGLLLGSGAKATLKKFGVVAGYQSVPVIGKRVAGYQSVPVIGNTPAQLAGNPAQLDGFRVNGYNPTGSGVGVLGALYTNADDGSGINNSGSGYME